MSRRQPLLVELLVEELPPKALRKLGLAFATALADALRAQGLAAADAAVTPYATSRRLAVHIADVAQTAADQEVEQRVMPVAVALDPAGQPTTAFKKAAAKLGRSLLVERWPEAQEGADKFYVRSDGKADAVFFRSLAKGAPLVAGLQSALDAALAALPIPKVMQYQLADGWSSVNFVRPAHGLVALHGEDVVPVRALGLEAGRTTRGHRFESRADVIALRGADGYAEQLLREGSVVAGFDARRAEIERQLRDAAAKQALQPVADDALLDEVTALVELPNVLSCRFEDDFLAVPQECLILTMKANQKYFPLLDANGRLTNRFLVVSNVRPADPRRVVEGNERVVRPRLADARFFFDHDRQKTLESRVPGLARVVYHARLGTMGDRVARVRTIAREVAQMLGGGAAAHADRAALLAKADLLTDMVGEFPELQGVMGGYYARHDGEPEAVALAIEDHYRPRFAGDALPRGDAGVIVALADKLETLAGLFGIGALPSGDKDPFALRRHALGVTRMLVERRLALALPALVAAAFHAFGPAHGQAQAEVLAFLDDRLVGYLREQGYSANEVDAVVALRPATWADVPQRLAAVRAFAALPEAAALAAANKRVGNILRKSAAASAGAGFDRALLREAAETALADAIARVAPEADAAFERGDYTASLRALAALRGPVDAFFDGVMVNTDDARLRDNRLALLGSLHGAMNRVADLSRLAS